MPASLILCVYRITRLITVDSFPPARWARERLISAQRAPGWSKELVECPWCVSFWVALVVYGAHLRFPRATKHVASVFAFSAAAAWLQNHEES